MFTCLFEGHCYECIHPLRTKLYPFDLKTQPVPRSKHTASVIKTDKLMLYRQISALCSEIRATHINALCGQDVGFLTIIPGGRYNKF